MGKNLEMTSGNCYYCKKTAKVQPICYLYKYYFCLNNNKSYFQAPMPMLGFMDNFEQYFESYVLNTQNPFKAALNKVNGLITSEKLSYQNCLWFLFLNMLYMARNKNPEMPEIN